MQLLDQGNPPRAEWPIDQLDVQELTRNGWKPFPITQFILKIHSRCNLACSYCYIYEKSDDSWRNRPHRMAPETLLQAATRIGEHAVEHGLDRVEIIFHGGEPLLAGPAYIERAVALVRSALPAGTALDATMQTNGVLLDAPALDALLDVGVRIGVSLDGAGNDRHRRYPDGRPSSPAVEQALHHLASPAYRSIYAGLLCVVDLEQDPVAAFERLREFDPPRVDFLLPHGDWTTRPPARPDDATTPYADWLTSIFDHWYAARDTRPRVRLFEELIQLLIGGRSRTESVGLSPAAILVIETDGAIEQVDTLRNAYPGAATTGLTVSENSIDDALRHPGIVARQLGLEALADECRRCRIVRVCGGGFYGHRFRAGTGFRNPSVYCPDLIALIHRIKSTVVADIRARSRPA
jgi:uncharacterized protein